MRPLFIVVLLILPFLQGGAEDSITKLTARAIREAKPDLCLKAKEVCLTSEFERSCISAEANQFMCYRDYAFAKDQLEICDKVKGESGGRPYRNMCYEQYAREKKDLEVCGKLKAVDPSDEILYVACVESVQRLRDHYTLEDCLKIKDAGGAFFIDCVGGLAKQTKDTSLCTRFFGESTEVDSWGDTPQSRCMKRATAKQ